MNRDLLQELGLSGHLADVYIDLLDNGPALASELAKRTNLTRTNVYMLLEKLTDYKLVSFDDSPKRVYTANNPTALKNLLSSRQQEIQETTKSLNSALPSMVSGYRLTHQQPGVLHIEGTKGIKELYDDIIRTKQEILIFPSDHDRDDPKIAEFIDGQILRQQLAHIPVRVLYSKNDLSTEEISQLAKKNISIRMFGDKRYDAQIIVYGDNVALSTFGDTMYTTIISSPQIAGTHRAMFDAMWNSAI